MTKVLAIRESENIQNDISLKQCIIVSITKSFLTSTRFHFSVSIICLMSDTADLAYRPAKQKNGPSRVNEVSSVRISFRF